MGKKKRPKRKAIALLTIGFIVGLAAVYLTHSMMKYTSTNEYCESCHIHPHVTQTWKQGAHHQNTSGVVVNCVDCHLPPSGLDYYWEKSKAGARDMYGFYFRDPESFDWEALSALEAAVHYTFDESCARCHKELYPVQISKKGIDAHIHYQKHPDEVLCINCHLKTGHFHEDQEEFQEIVEETQEEREWATLLSDLSAEAFEDYTETIPGSGVRFEMVAVDGGEFGMGSPEDESLRRSDEGPQKNVRVSSYWIGKIEVSWREFEAYYAETVTREKNESGVKSDAITGPTPPYGSPDQGWGRGSRPAITMTHYAAQKYCEWLSMRTGREYRLPTEAEWEFAVRGGTTGPFFFEPVVEESFFSRLFGAGLDEELVGQYAWFQANSSRKSHPPFENQPNPLGIQNMLGNVKEFCSDWYDPEALQKLADNAIDPTGPEAGTEYVIRGGSFSSGVEDLRSAARDQTQHDRWMRTDPQLPKSVWWYSDNKEVGFRVVRARPKPYN
jgi:cytochrome c nitrite reductase small subunit